MPDDRIAIPEINAFSKSFFGTISPNPIVPIVIIEKYKEDIYWDPILSSDKLFVLTQLG